MSYFMKVLLVGPSCAMRADGRTDMTTLKGALRNFAKNPLTNRTDEHPCSELVSNPQSQQLRERRHTPWTVRPPGLAITNYWHISHLNI